jgi:hypothetical protein
MHKQDQDLNSLARTLAERLVELKEATVLVCDFDVECVNPESAIGVAKLITEDLEAVIREAIEKTLEQTSEYLHHDKICAHRKDSQAECDCGLHKLLEAYAAIRSLKQSNSGMEVQHQIDELRSRDD